MNLQEVLDNAVNAQRNEKLKTSPQLLLGELILKLEAVEKKDLRICFDFEYAFPTHLSSWRGSYCELAISFEFEGNAPTVEEFLKKLNSAIGQTFTGYKGGDFTMGKNTPVWVANYGNSGNTGVVGVIDTGYTVIIETKYCEY